jgi:hypothetical protein
MNHLEAVLSSFTVCCEIVLCVCILARKAYRVLPLFSVYAVQVLISTVFVWFIYDRFGFTSSTAARAFWYSAYVSVTLRSLVVVELCRYGLREYRGIWGLAWRALVTLAFIFIIHAAVDARGQPDGFAIFGATLLSDLAFASLAILAALLAIRSYYGLTLDSLQRLIATGMAFTCAADAVGFTMFRRVLVVELYAWFVSSEKALWPQLAPQVRHVDDIWSSFHLISFMIAMGIWCYALRGPVTQPSRGGVLLPPGVYGKISSAINVRLASFNERLVELLKP